MSDAPADAPGRVALVCAGHDAPTTSLLAPGQLLAGQYRVLEKIGTGGMGLVYKVQDERLNRPFAIKVLPPDMARNANAVKRLTKEAQAAIDLHHPNVMGLLGLHADGDTQFLVMEYLDGQDLDAALVDRGRLPVDEVLDIARQVCPAVAYAHSRGVLHRDLKPANLLCTTEGGRRVVKVGDFGIAHQVRASVSKLTGQDTSAGTVHYMPPEQVAGKEPDARSDQYSLAATLYELLRGRPPFEGAGAVLIHQIETVPPDPIPDVPAHVDRALRKALSKSPDDRFPDCPALLEALEGRAAEPSAGSRLPYVFAALLLLLLAALALVERSATRSPALSQVVAPSTAPLATSGPVPTLPPAATPEAPPAATPSSQPAIAPSTPPPPPPPALPPPPRPVKARFSSLPPGAKVYELGVPADKKSVGVATEPFVKEFLPGTHRFKFVLDGHRPLERDVPLDGPDEVEVRATLEPSRGTLRVTVDPPVADVEVDGVPLSASQRASHPVKPGVHHVTALLARHLPARRTVTVADREVSPVHLVLAPEPTPTPPPPPPPPPVERPRSTWDFLVGGVWIVYLNGLETSHYEIRQVDGQYERRTLANPTADRYGGTYPRYWMPFFPEREFGVYDGEKFVLPELGGGDTRAINRFTRIRSPSLITFDEEHVDRRGVTTLRLHAEWRRSE